VHKSAREGRGEFQPHVGECRTGHQTAVDTSEVLEGAGVSQHHPQHHPQQAGPAQVCCFRLETFDWVCLNSLGKDVCVCVGGGVSSSRGADQCCRESVQHAAATAYAGLPVIDAAAAAAAVPIGPRQMSLQLLVKLSQAAPSIMATLNWVMSLMLSWQRFHTDTLPLAGFQPLPGRLSSCSSLVSMSAQTLTVSILTPTAGNKFQMTPPTHTPFTSDPVVLPAALPPAAHPAQH
jgi:hypothetical protein